MRADRITANLPSRDFDRTVAFYAQLGFAVTFRDDHWLIMVRDTMEVAFFFHPDLVLTESWHSACIRVDDLDDLKATWSALGLEDDPTGRPRDLAFIGGNDALRFFALIDCDGSLLRCIDNRSV